MPPALVPDDESESYNSSEDGDFAPDDAPLQNEAESSDEESEDDTTLKKPKTGKRKHGRGEEAEDLGFENSGDEAIIDKGLKKRRRKGKGKGRVDFEDEGGEGGLVKTRSMRAAEKIEKKPLATTTTSTIDVDAIYQAMISGKPTPKPMPTPIPTKSLSPTIQRTVQNGRKETRSPSTTLSDGPESLVMIKRTYTFAGKVHMEQKLVPRSSAEAQLYLSSLAKEKEVEKSATPEAETSRFTKPKRPLKKARRSIFEPIPPEGFPQRTDLHFGERKETSGVSLVVGAKDGGKKINTVEKSKMDWAGFVDKEGIKDELVLAGKSKGAYKGRQEFLKRVEMKKLGEERRARGLPEIL